MPRPRGWEQLDSETRNLREQGVDVLVSTLTDDEIEELELAHESESCAAAGIEFVAYPIPDRTVPESFQKTAALTMLLGQRVSEGKSVVVHCRAGIGRSSTVVACVLVSEGMNGEQAYAAIAQARGWKVPDTEEQRLWPDRFAAYWRDSKLNL